MRDFTAMSAILSLLARSGVPSRWIGLLMAVFVHWLIYAWITAPGFRYVCKCVEALEAYNVPLSEEPDVPLVAWRGDKTVVPPQPLGTGAEQARSVMAGLSESTPFSIRLIVDTKGRVRECTIGGQVQAAQTESPNFICNRIRALRFRPAVDRLGRPVDYVLP